MKSLSKNMVICWSVLCLGLLWPVVIYMLLAMKFDAYHLSRAGIYTMVIIGLGVVLGRGIQQLAKKSIYASLLPTILAWLMGVPLLVFFHPLIYFSPEMTQLPGPGTPLLLFVCGAPVAMCALPYTVMVVKWCYKLRNGYPHEEASPASLNTCSADTALVANDGKSELTPKSSTGLLAYWILLCVSFTWPAPIHYLLLLNTDLASSRLFLGCMLYIAVVIVLGLFIGHGLYRHKKWAYYSSMIPPVISAVYVVSTFIVGFLQFARAYGLLESNGEYDPWTLLAVLVINAPTGLGDLLYLVFLAIWMKKVWRLTRSSNSQSIV